MYIESTHKLPTFCMKLYCLMLKTSMKAVFLFFLLPLSLFWLKENSKLLPILKVLEIAVIKLFAAFFLSPRTWTEMFLPQIPEIFEGPSHNTRSHI